MIRRRGLVALTSALSATMLIGIAQPASALPPPPPNPSDSQINGASTQKTQVAAQVQQLSAQLSQAQSQLATMQDQLQSAQENYNLAEVNLGDAQDAAAQTKADAQQAQADVVSAQQQVAQFARSSYIQGSTVDSSAVLLTADGPSQLIEQAGLLDAIASSNTSALQNLQTAQTVKANADSSARKAVNDMAAAEAAAKDAQSKAESSVAQSEASISQVQATQTATQQALDAAQQQLADLQGQRQQYDSWVAQKKAEEAAAAAAAAAQAAAMKAQAIAAAKAEQQKQIAAGQAAALAAAANTKTAPAAQQNKPSAAKQNNSSAAKQNKPAAAKQNAPSNAGQAVANAALQWLGTIYAWGGGTSSGPSRGVTDGGVADSYGDYNKIGFDCSGLALYAWAQVGIYLPHSSAAQKNYGSVHPSISQLQPGDLLFWGVRGIHHVAIYIGGGKVVQAPQSGDVVKVSSIWMSDYAGATRPGS